MMASDAEHPFICFWALCMSPWDEFRSFAHFLIGLHLPGVELYEIFMYFGDQTLV